MFIKRMELPGPKSVEYAMIGVLATSWYIKGLLRSDLEDMIGVLPREVAVALVRLIETGFVEKKTHHQEKRKTGYVITERGKELWDAREAV